MSREWKFTLVGGGVRQKKSFLIAYIEVGRCVIRSKITT